MKEDTLKKIEEGIFEKIKDRIENISKKEAENIIEKEIRARDYLSEDWRIHYAIQRIKELQNVTKKLQKLERPKVFSPKIKRARRIVLHCLVYAFFIYIIIMLLSIIFLH